MASTIQGEVKGKMNPKPYKFSTALIIDDSEMDIMLNKMILQNTNFAKKVLSADSASSALQLLQQEIDFPEVIFLDINMPGMDGFEFLEKFESLPNDLRKGCKIAIISSSEDLEDIEKAKEFTSVIKYLVKPLEMDELKKI